MIGRNYCTLEEHDPNKNIDDAGLSKASSRIGIPKFFKSGAQRKVTGRKDGASTGPKNSGKTKQDTSDSPQSVNATNDALEVTIRVEVNPKNPDGATKPYRLIVPPLITPSYDAAAGS